jgi:uncharacterized protein (TIGR03083 family)
MALTPYPFERARDAFLAEYGLLDELAASLGDEQLLLASRCRGWTVGDVLCHLHIGMEEILVGYASPTDRPADTDFASYWRDCCGDDGGELDLGHARFVRLVASAYVRPGALVGRLRRAMGAVRRLTGAADGAVLLDFQEHVLPVGDFLATWVVEAAVHHLDLTVELPQAPPPAPESLAVTRDTLDALLGHQAPAGWDDTAYALKGTGRLPLTPAERQELGPLADRFPLFG